MIFASLDFLLLFLPLVFAGYYLCQRWLGPLFAKGFLIAASFYFYWFGAGWFTLVFAASVVLNYLVGTRLGSVLSVWPLVGRRLLLAAGIAFNVAVLGYYKYTDFAISTVNAVTGSEFPLQHIILPIGISFWTFQMIAYVVDSYRGKTQGYSFLNYLNFIAFFPHLLVGPIVHHKELTSQFEKPDVTRPRADHMALGLFLIGLGAAKKLLLADPLTTPAQAAFDNVGALDTLDAWFHSIAYTISYYFDLSGYADMAIGLALLFNIHLPANFDSPYRAKDFADYWRRWHMTLSRFLGDYVFREIYRHGSSARFYAAVFITFVVSGFWHGAGWTFVLWGIGNGLFVMAAHFMHRRGIRIPAFVAWPGTFLGVVLLRVLFVSRDLSDAFRVYATMFSWHPASLRNYLAQHAVAVATLAVACAIAFFAPNSLWWRERFRTSPLYAWMTGLLLAASLLSITRVAEFLYFQF